MSLLHRPDDYIGLPSCAPTFYNKIAPMFRHAKFFYSTRLYAGCWKETFYTTFMRWRTK